MINPHNKIETIAEQMEVYKRALDDVGKPFPAELPMMRECFVARSRAEAIRLAQPYLETKYKAYKDWGQDAVMPGADAFSADFEDLMNDRFLFGSPAEVTEQILTMQRRFAFNTLVLGIHWAGMPATLVNEQMQLIAEEVFPAVRSA
jgi:hypothetical protein